MKPQVSVVIPTYNPRRDYLKRVLEALARQTLDRSRWEVVIVDNKSENIGYRISDVVRGSGVKGLSDVENASVRVVREEKLGLTHARVRGFQEAQGEIVVMVDDDNVLSPNYLEEAGRILGERPKLGAIGGKCLPEFETEPEPWAREFLPLLALRDHGEKEIVSGEVRSSDGRRRAYPDRAAPIGAGMVVRRAAAEAWLAEESDLPDRRGAELSSAGDNDLVFQILRGGWEVGYFPRLVVTHLIPKERLTAKYLARANRGIQRSWVQVLRKHDACPWAEIPGWTLPVRKARSWLIHRPWNCGRDVSVKYQGVVGRMEGLSKSHEDSS